MRFSSLNFVDIQILHILLPFYKLTAFYPPVFHLFAFLVYYYIDLSYDLML